MKHFIKILELYFSVSTSLTEFRHNFGAQPRRGDKQLLF